MCSEWVVSCCAVLSAMLMNGLSAVGTGMLLGERCSAVLAHQLSGGFSCLCSGHCPCICVVLQGNSHFLWLLSNGPLGASGRLLVVSCVWLFSGVVSCGVTGTVDACSRLCCTVVGDVWRLYSLSSVCRRLCSCRYALVRRLFQGCCVWRCCADGCLSERVKVTISQSDS